MKNNRLLYRQQIKNKDRKWYEIWKDEFIIEKYNLKLNEKGEVVIGEVIKK